MQAKGEIAEAFHAVASYIRGNMPNGWELRLTFCGHRTDIAVVNESGSVEYGETGRENISLVGILDYAADLAKGDD